MQSWADSVFATVGQCVTLEMGVACNENCIVVVSSSNPDCVVTSSISEFEVSSENTKNEAIRSIEVVKVVDFERNYNTKIAFAVPQEGLTTVSCFVLSGDSNILWANLTLD